MKADKKERMVAGFSREYRSSKWVWLGVEKSVRTAKE